MLSVFSLVLRCNAAISYIPTCSHLAIRHPPLHFTAHHLPIHFISFFAFQRLVYMRTCSSISVPLLPRRYPLSVIILIILGLIPYIKLFSKAGVIPHFVR